jgi:large subunit ribosomal protein L28
MARECDLLGTKPQFGHNVSHSNRRTKRRFEPNLQRVTFYSEALRHGIALRVTTRAIRTVQKHGGIDRFLVDMDPSKLGPVGQRLKRRVHKAMGGVPASS